MKIIFGTLALIALVFAQESKPQSESQVKTVIAIGEASLDKLSYFFKTESLDEDVSKRLSIIKEDLRFYEHLLDESKEQSGSEYIITIEKGTANQINLGVQATKADNSFSDVISMTKNVRSDAHRLADQIYSFMTGKKSIFLKKILFLTNKHSTKSKDVRELYLMDFDGNRKQRISFENSMIISPVLSADGTKVLFSAVGTRVQRSSRGKRQTIKNINLYEYDLRSKQKTLISNKPGVNSGGVYDPSGEYIYLTLSHAKNSDIYKMSLKTRAISQMTTHYSDDVDPHLSADGQQMVFLSGRSGRAMIYKADLTKIPLKPKRVSFVGQYNSTPRFSPDGSMIVFSSWLDNRFDIFTVSSTGSNLQRLTKNFGSNEEPWFSPDGEFIIFSSQKVISRTKATQDVYLMNKEGKIIKKLTENFGHCLTPRWSN